MYLIQVSCSTQKSTKMPTYNDYSELWKKYQKHQDNGRFQDALTVLNEIEVLALDEINDPQLLKIVQNYSIIQNQIAEDPQIKSINKLKSYLPKMSKSGQSVANSYYAGLLNQYYQNNSYKFYNLTEVENQPSDDISTWTSRTFMEKINEAYINSVDPALQNIPISLYKPLLEKYDDVGASLRPTMYDVVAHRAIDYFTSNPSMVTTPENEFVLKNERAYEIGKSFYDFDFLNNTDQSSLIYQALNIYQKLEKFRANDANQLVDITRKRLLFVHQNSTHAENDSRYLSALSNLLKKYPNAETSYSVSNDMAMYYMNKSELYQMGEEEKYKDYKKKAVEIWENGLKQTENKKAKENFEFKIANAKKTFTSVTLDEYIPINKPFKYLLEYNNCSKVESKIYKIEKSQFIELKQSNNFNKNLKKLLRNVETVSQSATDIPTFEQDMQKHSTEISHAGLPQGIYVLEVDSDDTFPKYALFQVTNLSIHGSHELYVINRYSGKEIPDCAIDIYEHQYSKNGNRYVKASSTKTAKDGSFELPKNSRVAMYELYAKDDHAFFTSRIYLRQQNKINKRPDVRFFTDRSIYRPGQTVFFKSIVYQNYSNQSLKVLAGEKVKVTFKDANYQNVESKEFTTNEYGSIHGSFDIPSSGLNGNYQFSISVGKDTYYDNISVEEYKRPKFEVVLDTLKSTFKLNDNIKVTGNAKTFSGVPLDNKKVTYTVTRRENMRYFCWYYFQPAPEKVITQGVTKTDSKGEFAINFVAEPNLQIQGGDKRSYSYEIKVDVLDSNGETRSGYSTINVSPWSTFIKAPENLLVDLSSDENVLKYSVENINQVKQNQVVDYKVYKLEVPSSVKMDGKWSIPQTQVLPRNEYEQLFPHDYYSKEDKQFKTNIMVLEGSSSDGEVNLSDLSYGMYKVVLTTAGGQESETQVTILNEKNKEIPTSFIWDVQTNKSDYQPGEEAVVTILTPLEDLHVQYTIVTMDNKRVSKKLLVNKVAKINIPIKESDRGGVSIVLTSVKYNRAFEETINLNVPYSNLDLNLTWNTFRSNLLPGGQEKWQFTLKDEKLNPVMAEVLASMYDASLDQFKDHNWNRFSLPHMHYYIPIVSVGFNTLYGNALDYDRGNPYRSLPSILYPQLSGSNQYYYSGNLRGSRVMMESDMVMSAPMSANKSNIMTKQSKIGDKQAEIDSNEESTDDSSKTEVNKNVGPNPIRTNLNETVFFFPTLKTNAKGETIIEFTMNEALTEWKLQTFAHTKDLKHSLQSKIIKTKKDLMVFPNGPRFFREGDIMYLPAKIANTSDQAISGEVELMIIDAQSKKDITSLYGISSSRKSFNLEKDATTAVTWEVKIPKNSPSNVTYQVVAKTGKHSDGEANTIIVLPNRTLVTESLPITVPANSSKDIHFNALDKLKSSSTLDAKLYSMSFTSNPTWLAIQSLPYMMEETYKCSEQIFTRLVANEMGRHIIDKNPTVETVYNKWREDGDLVSALNKNEELKSAILKETPWVMDALSEEEQMSRMANLFDRKRIKSDSRDIINQLQERQVAGGFPWFPGGKPNWYITMYILKGFGQLDQLQILDTNDPMVSNMINQGVQFIDREMIEYNERIHDNKYNLSPIVLYYLYVRSFYNQPMSEELMALMQQYLDKGRKSWLDLSIVDQARLALVFNRKGNTEMSKKIIESLRQRSIYSEELGRYWKQTNGYMWYQSGIENQSELINAFSEIEPRTNEIDEMKFWLLRNKQTNRWKSTKATTQAVLALVDKGTNWITETNVLKISNSKGPIEFSEANKGIGFIEKKYVNEEINTDLADFTVKNDNKHIAWGQVTVQYWEDTDKVENYQETPLTLSREYYKKTNSSKGSSLMKLSEGNQLNIGDVLTVKIQINVDRPMEFIHLKDMRASNLEPTTVLSGYRYSGGLSYYMETKDVVTNFFIDYLPRGKYTIEYDLRVQQAGNYSAGLANIQSMYAPEFGAHSAGKRIKVNQE